MFDSADAVLEVPVGPDPENSELVLEAARFQHSCMPCNRIQHGLSSTKRFPSAGLLAVSNPLWPRDTDRGCAQAV